MPEDGIIRPPSAGNREWPLPVATKKDGEGDHAIELPCVRQLIACPQVTGSQGQASNCPIHGNGVTANGAATRALAGAL